MARARYPAGGLEASAGGKGTLPSRWTRGGSRWQGHVTWLKPPLQPDFIHYSLSVIHFQLTSLKNMNNRNQPCPCGSGKKFKHCCGDLNKQAAVASAPTGQEVTIPNALVMALQCQENGQWREAEYIYRQVLQARPDLAEAHNELGNVLEAQNRIEEAIRSYQQAVQVNPKFAIAYSSLGYVLGKRGNFKDAITAYRHAIDLEPDFVEVQNNLGCALHLQNQFEEAIAHLEKALQLRPDFVEASNNLGNVFLSQGQFAKAELCYRHALQIKPDFAEAWSNLGSALINQEKYEEAVTAYQQTLQWQPERANAYRGLGDVYRLQGLLEEAKASYGQALILKPSDVGAQIRRATLVPVIMESKKDIAKSREAVVEGINQLLNSNIHFQDPFEEGGVTHFFLVYQGQNDRNLQVNLAILYEYACPSLLYTAPHCPPDIKARHDQKPSGNFLTLLLDNFGPSFLRKSVSPPSRKIKIGFMSHFFKNHTIGKVFRGLIANLSRDWFTVHVFFVSPVQDDIYQFIQEHADATTTLPLQLTEARQLIANQQLDVLVYTDIGMDTFTYFLAFARLAPVQCTTWGHPVTTGIRNIDYYISSRYLEPPEDYQTHYSERVELLNSLLTFYYKPTFPAPLKPRSHFGLTDPQHIYLCPQTLFKLHPDFDLMMADILKGDPQGQVVLVEGLDRHWGESLKTRLQRTVPEVIERIVFLPRQTFDDYLNLIAIADVMLDPCYFGGGSTTYEAIAVGIPIVTYPSAFMRGRFAYGCYKRMGVLDCVADSPQRYVEIALQLGTDPSYREKIRNKLLKHHHLLYEDKEVIREFERFFVETWRKVQ